MYQVNSMMRFRPSGCPAEIIKHEPIMGTSGFLAPTGKTVESATRENAVPEAPTKRAILPYKDIFAQTLGGSEADIFYRQDEDEENAEFNQREHGTY